MGIIYSIMTEKFCFAQNISKTFSNLRSEEDFYDVTLVCNDNSQISAHQVVLSSCSDYFKKILKQAKHPHPWLCVENVSIEELGQVMDYIYVGEIKLFKEKVDRFVEVAKRFKIKGMNMTYSKPLENIENENVMKSAPKFPSLNDGDNVNFNDMISEIYETYEEDQKPKISRKKDRSDVIMCGPGSDATQLKTITLPKGLSIAEIDQKIYELISKNQDGFYCCKLCGKVGEHNIISKFKIHVETHLEGVFFTCKICGKQCKTRGNLSTHRSRNHYPNHPDI